MTQLFKKQIDRKTSIITIAVFLFMFFIFVEMVCESFPGLPVFFRTHFPRISLPEIHWPIIPPGQPPKVENLKKFSSEEEFKSYLEEAAAQLTYYYGFGATNGIGMPEVMPTPLMKEEMAVPESLERVSETTVQVKGIDEPDIVKTNGKEIYFSGQPWSSWRGIEIMSESMIWPSPEYENRIKVIKAFPPTDLGMDSKIDNAGNLLLSNDILVVFAGQKIYGYDVSDPKSPEKKWEIKLEDNNFLMDSRLFNHKIYLVTSETIDQGHPCPIKPLEIEGESLTITCQDIYHPVFPVPVDVTFVVMILDPSSGKIEKTTSFVGSSSSSVVYMSENAIYTTYSYYESMLTFFLNFLKSECQDIIPSRVIEKLKKVDSYDISQEAKMLEFENILESYSNSLDDDERLKLENELSNRLSDYYKSHMRELEKTGIVKLRTKDLEIVANGSVPGRPLNQFALDEYQDHLRVATTMGEAWFWGWEMGAESANDVYVLDEYLRIQGSVQGLGLTERIYSVRFIEGRGYVVTFRETDPFYVLDLSDPKNPALKGELKIPGYSSYLHPIDKDKILGIGKENWQVKISLFNVSSPSNPKEIDKYILDESWSDVLNTHHAFLLDSKHEIFFLPGSEGGYIFSYKDNKLELVRAVAQVSAKRAIYLNDYLYIISDSKITVLNEIDWEQVNELEF